MGICWGHGLDIELCSSETMIQLERSHTLSEGLSWFALKLGIKMECLIGTEDIVFFANPSLFQAFQGHLMTIVQL